MRMLSSHSWTQRNEALRDFLMYLIKMSPADLT